MGDGRGGPRVAERGPVPADDARAPVGARGAARARQPGAAARRVRGGAGHAGLGARADRARDVTQPVAPDGRDRARRPAPGAARPGQGPGRRGGRLRSRAAVRAAGAARASRLRPRRRDETARGGDLPPARRAPAGDRARRGAEQAAGAARPAGPAGEHPRARGPRDRPAGAPADAAGDDRLEPRPPAPAAAHDLPPARRAGGPRRPGRRVRPHRHRRPARARSPSSPTRAW